MAKCDPKQRFCLDKSEATQAELDEFTREVQGQIKSPITDVTAYLDALKKLGKYIQNNAERTATSFGFIKDIISNFNTLDIRSKANNSLILETVRVLSYFTTVNGNQDSAVLPAFKKVVDVLLYVKDEPISTVIVSFLGNIINAIIIHGITLTELRQLTFAVCESNSQPGYIDNFLCALYESGPVGQNILRGNSVDLIRTILGIKGINNEIIFRESLGYLRAGTKGIDCPELKRLVKLQSGDEQPEDDEEEPADGPPAGGGGAPTDGPPAGGGGTPADGPPAGGGGTPADGPPGGGGGTPTDGPPGGGGGTPPPTDGPPGGGGGPPPADGPPAGAGGTPPPAGAPPGGGGGTPTGAPPGGGGGTPTDGPPGGGGGTPPPAGPGGTPTEGHTGSGPCGPGYPANFPVWACSILKPEDIHPQVKERPILTPEYVGDKIYDDVMAADAFKENKRIYEKVGLDYPYPSTDHGDVGYEHDRQMYEAGESDKWRRKFISTKYPHKTIYDEYGVPFKIPNPYRSKAIRDQYTVTEGQVTFASPNTTRYSNEVRAANSALVKAFAFDSLLFDKDMTNAFLTSLWHCANPIQGGEKCTPAQVIMRLREFEQFKNQNTKAAAVQDLRGWPELAGYLETALLMMESLDMPRASAAAVPIVVPIQPAAVPIVVPIQPAVVPIVVTKPLAPKPAAAPIVVPIVVPKPAAAPKPLAPKPLGPKPAVIPKPLGPAPVRTIVPLTGLADRLKRLKGFGPHPAAKPPAGFGPQLRYIVPVPAKKAR